MDYLPPLASAKPIKTFKTKEYSAALVNEVQTTGVIEYIFLFIVYSNATAKPVLVVSSELFDGGPDTVVGIFDKHGHRTLNDMAGDWKNPTTFLSTSLAIVKEQLGLDLTGVSPSL